MKSRTLLAPSIAAAAIVAATGASAQSARYDGNWSVLVLTEKGDCNRVLRFPIIIEGGRARYGGPEGVAVSGNVGASGAVRGSIGGAGTSVNVSGRLAGVAGTGTWTSGGSSTCSGRWQAEKRG